MTISTTTIKNSYSGNGSTTTFNYTFKITDQDDIDVIIRSSSGTETTKTITTHYTVTGVGNANGGTVVFTSGNIPSGTETVVLRRSTPLTQGVDLIENDPLPANTLEDALDKVTSITQELQEQLNRSLKVSRTATINTPEITDDATARGGKLLGFSADGNSLDATIDGTGVAASATAAASSATAAATSATAAASSATAAANAQAAAETALDTFDDDFLGSKSSNPTVDNDGNALADGALYFDTTNNVMKVYDLGNTQWKQLTPTSSQQTAIDAAVANATNINAVAGAASNINAVAADLTDINTLAGISNLGTLGTNATAVVNAGNNITGINSFAERYRVQAGVPGSSNDVGDLVFDTTANKLKVFDGASYALAGSSVNGTSARFRYVATASQTTFSGADANGNSLTYDVASGTAFADVYLNGVKLDTSDFTATNGTSIVLGSGATVNDILTVVAYGTFNLASFSASNLTSGTIADARIPDLNASKITAGTFAAARLGSGTANSTTFLRGDGTFAEVAGGTSWQAVKTTNFTAVAGEGYFVNTTSGAITVTFPSSAAVGDTIVLVDYARNFGTNKLIINPNSLNFQGNSSPNPEYNTDGQSITCVFADSTKGWIPQVDDDVTFETPQFATVSYLCIAGGGGVNSTSNNYAGGAGAGGYRSAFNSESSGGGASSETVLQMHPGTTYTITVGAGGAFGPGTGATAGSDSSIAGSDITNVVSAGGGTSAVSSNVGGTPLTGGSGGSGGGGTGGGSGGSGTSSQGFNGGASGGVNSGGGGGGAGAVGSNGSGSTGGAGGNGVASTITGSSVTRGGGGGASASSSAGAGGTGGGGTGNVGAASSGSNGTVNTGGGAAGFNGSNTNGNGGSGVVILRLLTSKYSGASTSGSPTVTTSGSDTILTFNASGSLTLA